MTTRVTYRIEHEVGEREGFGPYWYRIHADDELIARYWHDYRGDDHGLEFVDGRKTPSPLGRMTSFLEGGGPLPLTLSEKAVALLEGRRR